MRSPKKKPFSESRKNSKFKVTNWPEYNNILRNRGRIDFMIAEDLSDGWYKDNDGNKKRGGRVRYSFDILPHLKEGEFFTLVKLVLSRLFPKISAS
jgi:hypothetical protein